ncbi:MAG: helix-turn-helix transcriptional regulator [Bacillota bacterium]
MFTEPYILSIYIIAFLLGAVVTTLNIIISKKQRTTESYIFMTLSLVLLLYLIFEFYTYYHINSRSFNNTLRAFILLTNICYYFFIYFWIRLLSQLSGKVFSKWRYALVIGVYGFTAETIGWNFTRYQPEHYFIQVAPGLWQKLLLMMNLSFGIWLFCLSVSFLLFGIHSMEKSSSRKGVITFSCILMFYMLWIIVWDYRLVKGRPFDPPSNYSLDPMIVFYIAYSISVVWIFYKKDPLEICRKIEVTAEKPDGASGERIDSQYLRTIAENCHLTEREIQVLELINKGLSNPEIGKKLFISENTVKRHVNNIFSKTGTKSRYELLSFIYNFNK